MADSVEEIIKGRKVFFIAPDRSLFPENYLEEYLTLGYECYFVDSDIFLPISIKIDIILSIFVDSILFFNIDAPIQNLSWETLIARMHEKYPNALFGVTYAKKQSLLDKQRLERYYLMDLGIQCGCVQLEYQKKNNFGLIERMLFANQARGHRKNVRAICDSSCSVKFYNKQKAFIREPLNDLSLSHFSITIEDAGIEFNQYEKIDAQFLIKGQHISSNAVLFMVRQLGLKTLYIFAFCTKEGQPGLDVNNKQILTSKIYNIMQDNCKDLLGKLFRTAAEQHNKLKKK